jgi:CRP-like cAMP-binding protein
MLAVQAAIQQRPKGASGSDGRASSLDEKHGSAGRQKAERNRILRAMSPEDYAWITPHLKSVQLPRGETLVETDEAFRHVYFIETGVASVVNHVVGGPVEVGTIGNEGLVGLSVYLDGGIAPNRTFMQVAGEGKQVAANVFAEGAEERVGLRRILHKYTQAFLTQVSQTAACNRAHPLDQRCARWLLMTHDRVDGSDTFPMTHEFLSFMLGVRRAGVTVAAGDLQKTGLIKYTRGKITVTDRAGLEAASCECYGVVRDHFDRLLA